MKKVILLLIVAMFTLPLYGQFKTKMICFFRNIKLNQDHLLSKICIVE